LKQAMLPAGLALHTEDEAGMDGFAEIGSVEPDEVEAACVIVLGADEDGLEARAPAVEHGAGGCDGSADGEEGVGGEVGDTEFAAIPFVAGGEVLEEVAEAADFQRREALGQGGSDAWEGGDWRREGEGRGSRCCRKRGRLKRRARGHGAGRRVWWRIMGQRSIKTFRTERAMGQKRVLETEHVGIKRFFNLDSAAYRDGALPGRTKELLGLAASMVLRCNDCIDYHLEKCVQHGYSNEEIEEAMNVALVVGGSIVIPHLRHARLSLDELLEERRQGTLPALEKE